MLEVRRYDRAHARDYALRWALFRNPLFLDFEELGGDCTGFASQCILAGSCQMNDTPLSGWYYVSPNDRAPAWTGVEPLCDFLVSNRNAGPFGRLVNRGGLRHGDIIQLGSAEGAYYHSLVVTGFARGDYLISAHSNDARNRRLSTFPYERIRFIHIEGVRSAGPVLCFRRLYHGIALPPI